jgi:hypothetical protein
VPARSCAPSAVGAYPDPTGRRGRLPSWPGGTSRRRSRCDDRADRPDRHRLHRSHRAPVRPRRSTAARPAVQPAADAARRCDRVSGRGADHRGHRRERRRGGLRRPTGVLVRAPRRRHRLAGRHGLPRPRRGLRAQRLAPGAGLPAPRAAQPTAPQPPLLADQPDPAAAGSAPLRPRRSPRGAGRSRGPRPAGPPPAPRAQRGRGHVRQARPGAVHPARPPARGVHRVARPAAGPGGTGAVAPGGATAPRRARDRLEDLFADVDRTPLAAASVGQVHAATLPSGEQAPRRPPRAKTAASASRCRTSGCARGRCW